MKKIFLFLAVVAILAAGLVFFIRQGGAQALGIPLTSPEEKVAAAEVTATPIPPVIAANEINASGRLVPAQFMDLSFQTEGTVVQLLVAEGQKVEKSDLIAQLGDKEQVSYEISQAQLDVLNAQKSLDDLYKNAPMIAAQANYDINEVQKELDKAVKRRKAMNYAKATKKDIDNAYRIYKQAADTLKEINSFGDSTNLKEQDIFRAVTQQRDSALANYNWLTTPYTDKEKAEQDAIINLNQQKLDDLKQKYALYSKGPDPKDVTIAQAQVEVAKSQLALAEAKRARLELRAPFTGIVTNLPVKNGQMVTAGQTILTLADISRWHVETEDLTEINITRIREGTQAVVKFDAMPGETFNGKVVAIKNYGVLKKGDITYTVVIEIEKNDPRMLWNMTAPITIKTE